MVESAAAAAEKDGTLVRTGVRTAMGGTYDAADDDDDEKALGKAA